MADVLSESLCFVADGNIHSRMTLSPPLSFPLFVQASAVPAAGAHLREVRAGHVHPEGPVGGRRGRVLVRVLQRGHRGILQAGKTEKGERKVPEEEEKKIVTWRDDEECDE